ncbi:MAG: rod shape-determining protein MreC [Candidatus Omnitrophica bacterium]|nr:rod shape-determining protein MreC [Candidatus Omnitrophota bacterium]
MLLKDNQKNIVYFILLLVMITIVFSRLYPFASLKFKIIDLLSGPVIFFSSPVYEVKKMVYYHRTFKEYKKLRKEVEVLRARLVGFEEVIVENARLERLLEFKRELIYSSVGANVVGRDPSNWNATFVIDKGGVDGIKQGMAVVSSQGIVGKIAEVSDKTSKVILITDPRFSVAALVQRPRESGLVSGTLQGVCRMTYVDEDARINIGDIVITSKLSSSFPESLVIGEVIHIEDDQQSGSIICLVHPAVQLSQVEEVLVLIK